jgi:hypothetical protein
MFKNPVLLKAIKAQWFSNPKAEGVLFHMYFNPISIATIALVFTAVSAACWLTSFIYYSHIYFLD